MEWKGDGELVGWVSGFRRESVGKKIEIRHFGVVS